MTEFTGNNLNLDYYTLFRVVCGMWFLLDLLSFIPWFYRDFGKPYQPNSLINTKLKSKILIIVWFLSSINLILPGHAFFGSFCLSIIFRYYYIYSRPHNLFRGGGAVGMYPTFISNAICLIELGIILGFSNNYIASVLLIMSIHLGITIFDAGLYKVLNGYYKNEGIEYALNNHLWTYWSSIIKKINLPNYIWLIPNFFISFAQLFIGILLINPFTVNIGLNFLSFGFIFLGIFLKLGTLPFLVGSYQLLVKDFTFLDYLNINFDNYYTTSIIFKFKNIIFLESFFILIFYLLLLIYILVQFLLYFNFYKKIRFSKFFQNIIDFISLYSPVIIWRVFSPDVVNLVVNIYELNGNNKLRINNASFYNGRAKGFFNKFRYFHVAESCVLSSIFNSVKYDDNNLKEAKLKLLRYNDTVKEQMVIPQNKIMYQVIILKKINGYFKESISEEWTIDRYNNIEINYLDRSLREKISKYLRPFSAKGAHH